MAGTGGDSIRVPSSYSGSPFLNSQGAGATNVGASRQRSRGHGGGAPDSGADMDTMGVKGHYTVSQPFFIVFV